MLKHWGIRWAFALCAAVFAFSPNVQATQTPETGLRLFAAQPVVAPGQSVDLAFEFDVKPGWHLYWKNPGDTGLAPMVRWSGTEGVDYAPLSFPTPETFSFAGFTNYGYLKPFSLLTRADVPVGAMDQITIDAALEWLACDDKICVPESGKVTITLNIDPQASSVATPDPYFAEAREALPLKASWPATADIKAKTFTAQFQVPFVKSDIDTAMFYPAVGGLISYEAEQKVSWPTYTKLQISIDAQGQALDGPIAGVLKVWPKGGGPAKGYDVTVAPGAVASGEAAVSPLELDVSLPGALVFALIGGLLLNLMPCVFPVLSLKALSFAQSAGNTAHAKREGWFYTAGILVSFAALAGGLLAIRAAGNQLGWGFQLQSPIVIAVLALVMFLIGLNLLGAFEVSGRFSGIGQSWLDQQSGAVQSFFTGMLATVVATPCTAPFMASALSFALVQPAPAAMAIFLALGVGLALPFLLITHSPWLRNRLPKPGAWMDTFKQVLAFPMFLTMLWLLWVLSNQGGAEGVLLTLGSAILLGFAIWAFQRGGSGKAARIFGVMGAGALVIAALGLWQVEYRQKLAAAVPATLTQEVFSETRLAALVAQDAPVFVYFTADWCITCKANERLALKTNAVKQAFEENGVTVLKADWTRKDDAIAKVLSKFGRAGVPLYLYYAPGAKRPEELPQILRPAMLIDLVKTGAV